MSIDDSNGGDAAQATPPSVSILAQYIKDLSFENPRAPASLQQQENAPTLNINVNVGANPMSETDFEVVLTMEAKAELDNEPVFAVELVYAGLFRIQNVPTEHMHPFVLIECPRLLFPFARQILSEATRNGGFPPLMIDPIDFAALYRQNIENQAQAGAATPDNLN